MSDISTALPLPKGYVLQGHTIVESVEQGEYWFLYNAVSSSNTHVLIREFFPIGQAYRDTGSQSVILAPVPGATSIHELKCSYNIQFPETSSAEFFHNGTSYTLTQLADLALTAGFAGRGATLSPSPFAPSLSARKKSSSLAAIGFLLFLFAIGTSIFCYFFLSEPPPTEITKTVETPKPTPVRNKPQAPPITESPKEIDTPQVIIKDEPEPEPEKPKEKVNDDLVRAQNKLVSIWAQSQGKASRTLSDAYQDYAEKQIRDTIAKSGGKFSPAFENWLKKTNHQAEIFAAFYPADPSVATNADIIVSALGDKAFTYDQFVIAVAIARRDLGMGAVELGHQGRFWDVGQRIRQDAGWAEPYKLFCQGKKSIDYNPGREHDIDEALYKKLINHVQSKGLTYMQAWNQRKGIMKALNFPSQKDTAFADLIHEHMYRNNELRRYRDPYPTPVEFMAYLIDKYENKNKLKGKNRGKWYGVALDATPWEYLLPLAETRPLYECEETWNRYLTTGKIYTYGSYRRDDDPHPPLEFSMTPDPEWSRISQVRKIYEGGVCGTMSLIARNDLNALGRPSAPASQPGHGNLVTYYFTNKGGYLSIDHSVDSPIKTNTQSYLGDEQRSFNESHYLNAVGVSITGNISPQAANTARLCYNAYLYMLNNRDDQSQQESLNAMDSILAINPFLTKAWIERFTLLGSDIKAAVNSVAMLNKLIPPGTRGSKLLIKPKYNKELSKASKKEDDRIENAPHEYSQMLCAQIVDYACKSRSTDAKEIISKSEWAKYAQILRTEAKDNSYPAMQKALQLAEAYAKGADSVVKQTELAFNKLASKYKKSKFIESDGDKSEAEVLNASIWAAAAAQPKEKAVLWLKNIIESTPPKLRFFRKDNDIQLTAFFKTITEDYKAYAGRNDLASDIEKSRKEFEEEQ